jgi:hypothetical protein
MATGLPGRPDPLACLCRLVGIDRLKLSIECSELVFKLLLLVEDFLALPMQPLALLLDVIGKPDIIHIEPPVCSAYTGVFVTDKRQKN